MLPFNFFRHLGDFSHLTSKLILIFTIHFLRSAEGVSLLTQTLYALVFCTRYLDLFWTHPTDSSQALYNTIFKIFYISSSFYILYLMFRAYPRTRESEREWKISALILSSSIVLTPLCTWIFREEWYFTSVLRHFSLILESMAVLPQLTLLAHATVPTAITSYYLVALGLYRALYILNWIQRASDPKDPGVNKISATFGVIQTLLYIEFAWIYWRRQKVKLRSSGGVLDEDEFAKGIIFGRLIAIGDAKAQHQPTGGAWRGQGISISADDFVVPGADDDDEDGSADEIEQEGESSGDDDESDLEVQAARPGDIESGLLGGGKGGH